MLVLLSWLERMVLSKTFDADTLELEQDIVDIRQLLEDSDKAEESTY